LIRKNLENARDGRIKAAGREFQLKIGRKKSKQGEKEKEDDGRNMGERLKSHEAQPRYATRTYQVGIRDSERWGVSQEKTVKEY